MSPNEGRPTRESLDYGAEGGNRTRTVLADPRILSPVRLPISPPRQMTLVAVVIPRLARIQTVFYQITKKQRFRMALLMAVSGLRLMRKARWIIEKRFTRNLSHGLLLRFWTRMGIRSDLLDFSMSFWTSVGLMLRSK